MKAGLKTFSLLIKPVGSLCNLECDYCFYLGTDAALGGERPAVMPQDVLEQMVRDFLGLGFPTSVFTWQGGEPTLAGLDFYRRAVRAQQEFGRGGQSVANALQTNGILLDDQWAEFLAHWRFLVGLSLDGPSEVHDRFRRDRRGEGTFGRVMRAVEVLRANNVEFNILSMVTSHSCNLGREIYRWLTGQGFAYLQFIPCVENDPDTGVPVPAGVSATGYGKFLCEVFDEWTDRGDTRRVSVRLFDSLVAQLAGEKRITLCEMGARCDHYLVVEKDGGVYPCDFFVSRRRCLGNLMNTPLSGLFLSDRESAFAALKSEYPDECSRCRHLDLCRGGCPKDRLSAGGNRFGGKSRLCEGLLLFLDHARPALEKLADKVRAERRAVTGPVADKPVAAAWAQAGRNDPCPCGSGRKYKHCCMP